MENLDIDQNKDIKKQLKKLRKLINQTKDPTKPLTHGIQTISKAEFWLFRPRWWVFLSICILFIVGWWAKRPMIHLVDQDKILSFCLRINVSIFVIGISLATSLHSFSKSGQFSAEYLYLTCRLPDFSVQTFLSVLFAVSAFFISWPYENDQSSFLTYIVLGSTIAIIPSFLFMIITLIRCTNPKEAIKAVTLLSTNRLTNFFANDAYLTIKKEYEKEESIDETDRYQYMFSEEWDIHLSKIKNEFRKAIESNDLEQIKIWLKHFIIPIHVVFDVCKTSTAVFSKYNFYISRLHNLLDMYRISLNELLFLDKRVNSDFVERGMQLIVKEVNDEVYTLFKKENFYCLRPLLWIVPQLYLLLHKSEYSKAFNRKRAYFGIFYDFPQTLFEKLPDYCTQETRSNFRHILHEGFTSFLLIAIREKDYELAESLCEAGRDLVFGDGSIDIKKDKALLQHLVLAGKLISDQLENKTEVVSAKNFEMLFPDSQAKLQLNLSDLATLCRDSYPTIETYLYRFIQELGDAWQRTHYNPLRGSGWSIGTQYNGGKYLNIGFLYASALTLQIDPVPDPIPIDITITKTQLSELKKNHAKLEPDDGNMIGTYLDLLSDWIDKCKKKKDEDANLT